MIKPATLPKPRRKRRWLKRIGITILILPFLAVAAFGIEWKWTRVAGQRKLDSVTARLDVEDPGWRFDDIVAAHNAKVPPDAENSALKAVEIVKEFPKDLGATELLHSKLKWDRLPNETPSVEAWNALEEEFPKWERLIIAARAWNAEMPRGRLPINYNGVSPMSIRPDGIQSLRKMAFLIDWDAVRSGYLGRADESLIHARSGLHLVRSITFEPYMVPYIVRIAMGQIAMGSVAQTLAWCPNASDPELAATQDLIWNERDNASVKPFIRGERGYIHLTIDDLVQFDERRSKGSSREQLREYSERKYVPEHRAFCLERFNELLPLLDQPYANKYQTIKQFELSSKTSEIDIVRLIFRSVVKVIEAEIRYHATCLCTAAGIACERYRLKHNRWPASLDDLAEFGIPKGLIDPFDGQPLRVAKSENGIVVYSIGPDGIDHDGEVVTRSGIPRDVGFRLWDVKSRKVPQPPPLIFDDTEKD